RLIQEKVSRGLGQTNRRIEQLERSKPAIKDGSAFNFCEIKVRSNLIGIGGDARRCAVNIYIHPICGDGESEIENGGDISTQVNVVLFNVAKIRSLHGEDVASCEGHTGKGIVARGVSGVGADEPGRGITQFDFCALYRCSLGILNVSLHGPEIPGLRQGQSGDDGQETEKMNSVLHGVFLIQKVRDRAGSTSQTDYEKAATYYHEW